MSIANQRAPVSAIGVELALADVASGSQRIAEPALMPTLLARGGLRVEARTPGAWADSAPGDGAAVLNGMGSVSEHPASSDGAEQDSQSRE